jgi:hypothetical protein
MEVAVWLECLVYVQACRCCHWGHPLCFPGFSISGVAGKGQVPQREQAKCVIGGLEDATKSWRPRAERNKTYEGRAVNCDCKRQLCLELNGIQ